MRNRLRVYFFFRRRWDSIVLGRKIAELRVAETRSEDLLTRK